MVSFLLPKRLRGASCPICCERKAPAACSLHCKHAPAACPDCMACYLLLEQDAGVVRSLSCGRQLRCGFNAGALMWHSGLLSQQLHADTLVQAATCMAPDCQQALTGAEVQAILTRQRCRQAQLQLRLKSGSGWQLDGSLLKTGTEQVMRLERSAISGFDAEHACFAWPVHQVLLADQALMHLKAPHSQGFMVQHSGNSAEEAQSAAYLRWVLRSRCKPALLSHRDCLRRHR